jgi:hypothetical protein
VDEAPRWREWPADPAAQKAALESVQGEVGTCIGLLDIAASRLPPARPLSEEEKAAIAGPLARVMWKYGANVPPELMLASALGSIAVGRWLDWKIKLADAAKAAAANTSPLADDKPRANGEARAAA